MFEISPNIGHVFTFSAPYVMVSPWAWNFYMFNKLNKTFIRCCVKSLYFLYFCVPTDPYPVDVWLIGLLPVGLHLTFAKQSVPWLYKALLFFSWPQKNLQKKANGACIQLSTGTSLHKYCAFSSAGSIFGSITRLGWVAIWIRMADLLLPFIPNKGSAHLEPP